MGLYREDTIRKAIQYLTKRGFIEQVKNPNPHYAFDRTRHFLFSVNNVADALNDYLRASSEGPCGDHENEENTAATRSPKNRTSLPKNLRSLPKNPVPSPKNRRAIPEITPEITSEISSESYSSSSAPPPKAANAVIVEEWPPPEQIIRDLEFLHGVEPMFAELQFVEFRSWWSGKGRFTQGEWDSKFLQRCVDQWDLRLVRQREADR